MDFEAAVAGGRDLFELRLDPVGGGGDAGVGGQVLVEAGEGAAIAERNEGGNRMLDLDGRDACERAIDGRIGGHGADGRAKCIQIAVGSIG